MVPHCRFVNLQFFNSFIIIHEIGKLYLNHCFKVSTRKPILNFCQKWLVTTLAVGSFPHVSECLQVLGLASAGRAPPWLPNLLSTSLSPHGPALVPSPRVFTAATLGLCLCTLPPSCSGCTWKRDRPGPGGCVAVRGRAALRPVSSSPPSPCWSLFYACWLPRPGFSSSSPLQSKSQSVQTQCLLQPPHKHSKPLAPLPVHPSVPFAPDSGPAGPHPTSLWSQRLPSFAEHKKSRLLRQLAVLLPRLKKIPSGLTASSTISYLLSRLLFCFCETHALLFSQ